MGFETIRYETHGPVVSVILNRPKKLNAINALMVRELGEALDRAEADQAIRVIVLSGEGKAFSAGFDLDMCEDESDDPVGFLQSELRKDFDIIMRFWDCPKPTVAAVHKYCLGSAMEMAVACDITVAAEGCRFGAPEVKFGDGIVSLILPWVIGPKQAKELLLTGDDRVSADRALALGLVNHVVPEAEFVARAMQIAREIAANDRIAVQHTKEAINRSCEIMGMRQALLQGLETAVVIGARDTPESREFNEILERDGAKAAIAWRDARLAKARLAKEGGRS
ncbi:MAG: enoyl-CoA hydratase/isomerase family protein [Deltaproteobacteria bacterium]|nr:enoyl-CoA hydratase/isomerase family protein [Deltaproteobacteria bacterium]